MTRNPVSHDLKMATAKYMLYGLLSTISYVRSDSLSTIDLNGRWNITNQNKLNSKYTGRYIQGKAALSARWDFRLADVNGDFVILHFLYVKLSW